MDGVNHRFKQSQPIGWQTETCANHYEVVDVTGQAAFNRRDRSLVGADKAVLRIPAPRSEIRQRASLTPAWIFSAVMPGGSAGSEKSTVAGSKPINTTHFIDPPPL
jgi:hypothetical protein